VWGKGCSYIISKDNVFMPTSGFIMSISLNIFYFKCVQKKGVGLQVLAALVIALPLEVSAYKYDTMGRFLSNYNVTTK